MTAMPPPLTKPATRRRAPGAAPPKPAAGQPRAPTMQRYDLYFMDIGRPTRRGTPFSCSSDEDARRCAEQRRYGRPAELRNGDRVVSIWARGAVLPVDSGPVS